MAWIEGPAVGPAGSSGILAAMDHAIARLAELGVTLPNGSRFQLLRAALAKAHNREGKFPEPEVLAEATRAAFELYLISRCLGKGPKILSEPIDAALRKILTGPTLPRDENEANSAARNFQFEVYVAYWLTAGGVAVRFAEPDLQGTLLGRTVGIAAKRVASSKQLLRRVKDAIEQIERSGLEGIIAINVDQLIDELHLSGTQEDITAAFEGAVPELAQALELASRNPQVIGVLALGMHVAWHEAEPRPQVAMSSFVDWKFFPKDKAEEAAINNFFAEFQRTQDERFRRL